MPGSARHSRFVLVVVAAVGLGFLAPAAPSPARAAERVISMNPSLTAIAVALGARESLVGVDAFSAQQQPAVAGLPKVGGLYNPSLEAVVSLEPDLVVLVPSVEQRDFRQRLEQLEIPVESFENIRFEQVLENIERLGALLGRSEAGAERIAAIREARRRAGERAAGRTPPRTLMVLQRDPLYVIGSGSFIDEMLGAVGARNLGREFGDAYPRVGLEWVVKAAPEVILDMAPERDGAATFWARWPSLPAVATGRVLTLEAGAVSLPGPYLDRSLALLFDAVHGEAMEPGGVAR